MNKELQHPDCEFLKGNKINFCFERSSFPCENLKRMDKKYIDRYGMNFVENLLYIKENGLNRFIQKQKCFSRCIELHHFYPIHLYPISTLSYNISLCADKDYFLDRTVCLW